MSGRPMPVYADWLGGVSDFAREVANGALAGRGADVAARVVNLTLAGAGVAVLAYQPATRSVSLAGWSGAPAARVALGGSLAVDAALDAAMTEQRVVAVRHDVHTSGWHGQVQAVVGAASGIVAPVTVAGRSWGWGCAYAQTPLTADGHRLVEMVAHLLGMALDVKQLRGTVRGAVDESPDLVARFDRQLRHLYANATIEHVTRRGLSQLLGVTNRELGYMQPPLIDSWEARLHWVMRTGREYAAVWELPTPLGTVPYFVRMIPEREPGQAVNSVLVIAQAEHGTRAQAVGSNANLDALRDDLARLRIELSEMRDARQQERETLNRALGRAAVLRVLSDRDIALLRCITAGLTNKQIGQHLGLTEGTVRNYVSRLIRKLEVRDRTQAAVRALALGLGEPADAAATDPGGVTAALMSDDGCQYPALTSVIGRP